jgi:hypothetical protein
VRAAEKVVAARRQSLLQMDTLVDTTFLYMDHESSCSVKVGDGLAGPQARTSDAQAALMHCPGRVQVVGSWSDWIESHDLTKVDAKTWHVSVALPPGEHLFKFGRIYPYQHLPPSLRPSVIPAIHPSMHTYRGKQAAKAL